MFRSGIMALVLGTGLIIGCGSEKKADLQYQLEATTISAAPVEQLTAAGGGRVGQGHFGTAVALFFPMDRAIGNSWMADINFNFNVHPNLTVELGAGWTQADASDIGWSGDLTLMPITANLQYGDKFGDTGRWYAGLGLGWSVNDFKGSGLGVDDSFAVQFLGGVDIPVNNVLGLNIELRYQLGNTDLSKGVTLDLDAFIFRVNMVWMF